MKENENKLIHTFGALAELGQEISTRQGFREMIRTSLHLLLGSLAIMRGGVAGYSSDKNKFNLIAGRGLGDEFPSSLSLGDDDEREFSSSGLDVIEISQARDLRFFDVCGLNAGKKKVELLVPLVIRDEMVGLVLLGEKANGQPYTSHDKEIICAMSRHIGVGISQRNLMIEIERRVEENRRLYDDLRFTYKNTVQAFAAAIDYKDKYTEGHSVRVGKYTEIIAAELGWAEEKVEGAAISGYLHDVGKLTVDRNIINAPYRINAKESADLNKHPAVGYEILLPIHHPFTDAPLAARHHHERIDGRGYPDGLEGREIPYIAKIVNLADSFDAMTTNRPYKLRRASGEVIEDLRRNSGRQFAPEIVAALMRAMLREVSGESKRKMFRRVLGKEYLHAETLVPQLKRALNGISATGPVA